MLNEEQKKHLSQIEAHLSNIRDRSHLNYEEAKKALDLCACLSDPNRCKETIPDELRKKISSILFNVSYGIEKIKVTWIDPDREPVIFMTTPLIKELESDKCRDRGDAHSLRKEILSILSKEEYEIESLEIFYGDEKSFHENGFVFLLKAI